VNLADVALVGVAGSAGAAARFVADGTIRSRYRPLVPVGTVAINISGSLLLGVLTGLVVFHGATPTLTLVAGTGFLGGYTTFSTASFETVRLVQKGEIGAAGLNFSVTAIGSLAAAAVGMALASL
jgi:CrcB protein